MNNQIKIFIAKDSDLNEIVELGIMLQDLHHKLDGYYLPGVKIREFLYSDLGTSLKNKDARILVAKKDNKIIGYLDAGMLKSKPFVKDKFIGIIYDTFVLPEYRGLGVMKKLLKKIELWFKCKNIKIIELRTNVKNELAINSWHKLGFSDFVVNMHKKIK
jgi:GNAT superfamily N-acetyltransferase